MRVMAEPYVIEQRPPGRSGRLSTWLRGRRLLLSAALALAELITLIVWGTNFLLAAAFSAVLLVLAVMVAMRLRKGALRDALWILALAQAMLVAVPLVLGFSLVAGLVVAVVLLVGLVIVAARLRV